MCSSFVLLELEKMIQFPTKSYSTKLFFILPHFATSFNISLHTCIYTKMYHLWSTPLRSSASSTTLQDCQSSLILELVSRLCGPKVQCVPINLSNCPGYMCLSRWTGFFQHLGGPELKAGNHRTLQSVKQPESSIFDHLRKRSLSCSLRTCVCFWIFLRWCTVYGICLILQRHHFWKASSFSCMAIVNFQVTAPRGTVRTFQAVYMFFFGRLDRQNNIIIHYKCWLGKEY